MYDIRVEFPKDSRHSCYDFKVSGSDLPNARRNAEDQVTDVNRITFFKTIQDAYNFAAVEGGTVWRVRRQILWFGWVLEKTELLETIAPSRYHHADFDQSRR